MSFWLQFISGGVILRTGRKGFNIYVNDGKFFVSYQGLEKSWTVERSCIPMGVFHVTATWSEANGLSYYENGKLIVSTRISDPSSMSDNLYDAITVGYESTSSGKKYSSLIIDDLMIWNLASVNVSEIYDSGKEKNLGRSS